MSLKRRFATSLAWAAIGSWSREIINFCVFLALARLLGPRAYGVMGMVGVALSVASAALVDGIANFIVREPDLEPPHINAVFWIQLAIAGVIAAAMVAIGGVLASLYDEPQITWIMPVMAAQPFLFALSSVPAAVLQREMRFRPLTVRSAAAAAVGGIVGIGTAASGGGVWSLVFMALAQWAVTCIVVWGATNWRPGFRMERRHFADVARFGVNAVGVKLLFTVDQQLPRFVIAASLGAVSLGYFTIAWRIIEVIGLLVLVPISQVALPIFATMQGDRQRLGAGVSSIFELTAAIALPAYLGLLAVTPTLLPVLSGAGWDGAIVVLQLFSLFGICWALFYTCDPAMLVIGQMRWRTKFTVLCIALMAVGLAVSYRYGLYAIAAAMVVREVVASVIFVDALRRQSLVDPLDLLRRIAPFCAAATLMLIAVLGWKNMLGASLDGPLLLASSVATGAIVYGASVLLLARSSATQLLELGLSLRQRRRVAS